MRINFYNRQATMVSLNYGAKNLLLQVLDVEKKIVSFK